MSQLTLVKNGDKYIGQYVAVRSFSDRTVVSHGSNPSKVLNEAAKIGVKSAVLVFIPQNNMVHVY